MEDRSIPEIASNFLACVFTSAPSGDLDSDKALVLEWCKPLTNKELEALQQDLVVLQSMNPYPYLKIGNEANRYFKDSSSVYEWVESLRYFIALAR
jgi:hypothetical protein